MRDREIQAMSRLFSKNFYNSPVFVILPEDAMTAHSLQKNRVAVFKKSSFFLNIFSIFINFLR